MNYIRERTSFIKIYFNIIGQILKMKSIAAAENLCLAITKTKLKKI